MTGIGRGAACDGRRHFDVEVRSTNARGLDVHLRLPPHLVGLETPLRCRVQARLERGKIYLHVRERAPEVGRAEETLPPGTPGLTVNRARADAAIAYAREIASRHGVSVETALSVLALPGVVEEAPAETNEVPEALLRALDKALDALEESTAAEGRAVAAALEGHLAALSDVEAELRAAAEAIPGRVRARIVERLDSLLAERGDALEAGRLEAEVALIAQKADVAEELDRLRAHLERARDLLARGGAVGIELGFLAQEMLREMNTIGAKSPDLSTEGRSAPGRGVVGAKALVERIREQAANLV